MATSINYELTYSNPAIKGHNGAETDFIMEVFRESLGNNSFHYNQTTLNANVITYNSIVYNYNNIVFSKIRDTSKTNIITFSFANVSNIYTNFILNSNINGFHKNINSL